MINHYDIHFEAYALKPESKEPDKVRTLKRVVRRFRSELDADELMTIRAEFANEISRRLYREGYRQAQVTVKKIVISESNRSSRKIWLRKLSECVGYYRN